MTAWTKPDERLTTMPIRNRPGWAIPEAAATPEATFHNRRAILRGLGFGALAATAGPLLAAGAARADDDDPTADLYPAPVNARLSRDLGLTPEEITSRYNNFYEFGSHKNIWKAAQRLEIRPWEVLIDGLVERELRMEADDLIRRMPLEERVTRHRCVEAWGMTVPWTGFPLRSLIDMARPLGSAKFLVMTTFMDPDTARGQRQGFYPWPYTEALTMAEASNELALVVTGAYGKPMARQFGAPLRLAVPWKYGFKHIKSIVRLHFAETRPTTFWEEIQPSEYGFWANVNPAFSHPRWTQATERDLGSDERIPTKIWNGYGEFVAHMYADMPQDRRLFM